MNTPTPPADSLSRRDFISRAAGLGAAAYLAPLLFESPVAASAAADAPAAAGAGKWDISVLEKWFFDGGDGSPAQARYRYTPEQTAEVLDEIGLDMELTLRKAGHISPERAPDELPAMVAALAKKNRRISYLAMDTVRPDEPHWEKALRVARQLGITRYRHRGFQYDLNRSRKAQIPAFTSMAREFAAANREIGVQAVYQTHSGARMVGGAAWDLDMVLADINPKDFGVAIDMEHVMIEQGESWPNAIDVLAPRIVAVCAKSFQWEEDKKLNEWRPAQKPLGKGCVKSDFIQKVIATCGRLPIIIHIEHFLDGRGHLAPVPFENRRAIVDAFRADASVVRQWVGAV